MNSLIILRKILKTKGGAVTVLCNILQKVEIETNLFNRIHFITNGNGDEHTLDGKTIHHFDIGIADHICDLFKTAHYKDLSFELMFETSDDIEDVNKQAIESITKQSFFARHAK